MRSGESKIDFALIVFLLTEVVAVKYDHEGQVIGRHMAPGWPARMFQPQTYRPETKQICKAHEPCGYYSFALLNGEIPFTWIQSWCNCSSSEECVYDKIDKRRRVYLEKCAPKEEINLSTTDSNTTSSSIETQSIRSRKRHRHVYRVTAEKKCREPLHCQITNNS